MSVSTHYELRVSRYQADEGQSGTSGLYVAVTLGDIVLKTEPVKKNESPLWNRPFTFESFEESDVFGIRILRKSRVKLPDRLIGKVDISISQILEECTCGEAQLDVILPQKKGSPSSAGTLYVYLKDADAQERTGIDIENARKDIERISASARIADSKGIQVATVVRKLDEVMKAVDSATKVHAYLNLAWQILSAAYRIVSHQFKQDQKLVDLVELMEKTFEFAHDAKTLVDKARRLGEQYKKVLKLANECCQFVREYTDHGFAERALRMNASWKMEYYTQRFSELKKQIDSGLSLHVASQVDHIWMRQQLEDLRNLLEPIKTNTSGLPRCLAGTRTEYLEAIKCLLFQNTEQNIVWLNGIAGSGKSTIAATIMDHCDDRRHLASFLFFRRGNEEHRSIIRSIAYQLAAFDPILAEHVIPAAKQSANIIGGRARRQFQKLLLGPLNASSRVLKGTVVIILDALDECGPASQRREILDLLGLEFSKLPLTFRFLITSRPENDIMRSLSSRKHIHELTLDHTSQDTRLDVDDYIRNELCKVTDDMPIGWKWDKTVKALGEAANGLFIWASTAIKMLRDSDDPLRKLENLTRNIQSVGAHGIDSLYETVLELCGIDWNDGVSRSRFRRILGVVLFAREALSDTAIEDFLGLEAGTATLTLGRLRSVLLFEAGKPVRLHHASFADYLTSFERSGDKQWYIEESAQKLLIVKRCFDVMKINLRFNICDLRTSYIRNDGIQDLDHRIGERIPSHLGYACLHWSEHLCDIPYSPDLLPKLSDFAYHHLLFWFEVVSLTKVFSRLAGPTLSDAAAWLEVHNAEISSFLRDASKLASEFAFPISQSTPHIYVSMLPLSKDESEISAHYSKRFSCGVNVTRRGVKRPSKWLKVLEGHSDFVVSVAVSPDGKCIASASFDKTVRVWDIDSGEEIFSPLTGHSDRVWSVCYSPDGKQLISGSQDRTLRIWDAKEGSLIHEPLRQHGDGVLFVTCSPDGKRIASGSLDQTITIWDAANGGSFVRRLEGHAGPIDSVAFSPNGARVGSGSQDKTIRLWNVESGELVLGPLEGHTDKVKSVAFSPDGEQVASGSNDETIIIWDVESGAIVSGPFRQHMSSVTSVAYSPCGTRIVSGSDDKTIIVWDSRSGEVITGPLEGHADGIRSVAFTADGRHIVSGSDDRTIRIWDTASGRADFGLSAGHRDAVWSVTFSRDGSRVASASADRTIIVWGAHTGDVVAGPLGGHTHDVYSIAFSLDGKRLVSGSRDKTVRIWDIESGDVVATLQGHTNSVFCVAVSPDGMKVVTGSEDKTIRVWDMAGGELIAGPLHSHSDFIISIAFSPDGKYLASGSWDKTIWIWDTTTWETVSEPLTGHTDWINSVCFSPDGTRLASGSKDKTVIVWDVKSCQIVAGPFRGHTNRVRSVIFSIDGRHVLSGSSDRTIRIWDIETGRIICKPLEGHTSGTLSLAVSLDGTSLASGSFDNTIRVWGISATLQPSGSRSGDGISASAAFAEKSLSNWVLGENGWIIDGCEQRDLLMWIPPDLRRTLWLPQNTAILADFSTQLDFTDAALGERWPKCFTPEMLEST